ncbi:stage III sporulation protein AD [Mangrovibacillus cuniculi]|uniref:stage III sporulation protein AD n=1 Tax=Mangrovibacillus cuniculi TaxID=2593652 RepID=UPI0023BA4B81|nr:stage III sporulation protein AD [Mangrovibacillus cuniculi]
MSILNIVGVALIATFLAIIIKEQKPTFALLLVLFVGASIFLFLMDQISAVIHMIERIAVNANVNLIYVETILKIIGIAYIAEFAAHITRDAGQGAIAAKVELAAKILILTMAIPILTIIIETVLTMVPKATGM